MNHLDLISLDHDLGPNDVRDGEMFDPGIGRDVSSYIAQREPVCPILIHSTNTHGSIGMKMDMEAAGWQCERIVPYGDLAWVNEGWLPLVKAHLN